MLKVKLNDNVRVIAGKDKGKSGKVIQVLPRDRTVVVEGLNKMYKYLRSRKQGEKGQRIEFAAPLRVSKLMVVCPKCNKASRLGLMHEGEQKKRVCKQCKTVID